MTLFDFVKVGSSVDVVFSGKTEAVFRETDLPKDRGINFNSKLRAVIDVDNNSAVVYGNSYKIRDALEERGFKWFLYNHGRQKNNISDEEMYELQDFFKSLGIEDIKLGRVDHQSAMVKRYNQVCLIIYTSKTIVLKEVPPSEIGMVQSLGFYKGSIGMWLYKYTHGEEVIKIVEALEKFGYDIQEQN